MAGIGTLDQRLRRVSRRLTKSIEGLVTEVIEEIGRELVPATPVDTGFARANWRPSLNAPASNPVSFLDPSGDATVARIVSVARRYNVGDTAFIVNRAPYIGKLNEGSSPQASAGFVQAAARRGAEIGVRRASAGGLL